MVDYNRATMNTFKHTLLLIALSLLLGCQERDGSCPDVSSVEPDKADPTDVITLTGDGFELGHRDLWDEATATPPMVYLDVSLRDSIPVGFESMFSDEELQALEGMDMTLATELVVLKSARELEVTLPDLTWSDIETSAEMFGTDMIELPAGIPSFDLSSTLRVVNPGGCEGSWSETFWLSVPVDDQTNDGGDDDPPDGGLDGGTDGDVEGDQ